MAGIVRCDFCALAENVPNVFAYRDTVCDICGNALMDDADKATIDLLVQGMKAGVVFEPDKVPQGMRTVQIRIDTAEAKAVP